MLKGEFQHETKAAHDTISQQKDVTAMNKEEINRYFNVDDPALDRMAKEYEDGSWEGNVGPINHGTPHPAED